MQYKLPDGMQAIIPYMIVKGAPAFIQFLVTVFNGKETHKSMRDDGLVMHAQVTIGGSTIMLTEATVAYPPQPCSIFIYVANADETYQRALQNRAESLMPPADQTYGRSCGVKDAFGNSWWVTSVQ